ncbi:MAG: hypothetical protein EA425_01490 [Puniceicoccaceae bacterium]|nr:MAG: hypothetical protein EA425_01490 [Puniceicoccaceae bacterium]
MKPTPLLALAGLLCFHPLALGSTYPYPNYEDGFGDRAAHLLDFLATWTNTPWPNFSDAHKHYWSVGLATIARSSEGVLHPAVNDGVPFHSRPPVNWGILKYDREPGGVNPLPANRGTGNNLSFSWNPNVFHFIFPGLAALMGLHPDIPAWSHPHHRQPSVTYREKYLEYILNRIDNFNAFTGEGTENHLNMSRGPGWVLASEAVRLGLDFPAAPFTAAERRDQMREWILDWSHRIYQVGIGEWDSGIYHMASLQGWFVVYEYSGPNYADDPEVRDAARAVLDFYAAALALKYSQGHAMGGAELRSGRTFSRMDNGTAYLAYLWFGETTAPPPGSWRGNQVSESVFAAVSSYRPPPEIIRLARRHGTLPATYHNTKPDYLLRAPGQAVEVVHHGPSYTLGSANLNIGGFGSSTWQIVNWKLLADHPESDWPGVFHGNGGFYGPALMNSRDPFAQFVQHRNILLQLHRVPSAAQDFLSPIAALYAEWRDLWRADFFLRFPNPDLGGIQDGYSKINYQGGSASHHEAARTAYLAYPAAAAKIFREGVAFLQFHDTYLAVRSLRSAQPADLGGSLRDSAAGFDQLFGFVLEVGSAAEHGPFTAFQEAVLNQTALDLSERDSAHRIRYRSLAGEWIEAAFATHGAWSEPSYDWDYGVTTPGGVTTMHQHAWRQPDWPSGEGHGRQPSWSVDGVPVDPSQWGVYSGPDLSLRDGILRIAGPGAAGDHVVDYSAERPVFQRRLSYRSWIADPAFALAPAEQAPDAIPALDGVANILKFALDGLRPDVPAAALPALEPLPDGSHRFSYQPRPGTDGVRLDALYSTDLLAWDLLADLPGTSLEEDDVVITFRIQTNPGPRLFIRLRASPVD